MNTWSDTPPADEVMTTRDTSLCTCRPARIAPDDASPDERNGGDPERHIIRGDD
ncbi:hypothetical protein [Streptomyces roseicoloratus]|uniref:hypothetical protein n=1 Tax=Streptomyces roseicoloratus TaxID=2508722 RepID=UPI0013E91F46|nr:hypothetical protein [Streptomyces roseicoloratus]